MLNAIKNVGLFIVCFIVAIIKLIINSFFAVKRITDVLSDITIILVPFYQPLIILVTALFFADKIDQILSDFILGEGDLMFAIIIAFLMIGTILFINAMIEFLFRIFAKVHDFNDIFSMQQQSHNYIMAIISLMAIYAAIDTSHASQINILLLTFGILIFICIVITDLYKALFLSNDIVKDIYDNLQLYYDNNKY